MAAAARSVPVERSPIATVLTTMSNALEVLFAARNVTAAFEAHRRPDRRDLAILGIDKVGLPADH